MQSDLFIKQDFISHSGLSLPFKIDCDALSDTDMETIAFMFTEILDPFSRVYGIATGGTRLRTALEPYQTMDNKDPFLIVDDVFTTGASMEEARGNNPKLPVIGAVIFARAQTPDWITPLFICNVQY